MDANAKKKVSFVESEEDAASVTSEESMTGFALKPYQSAIYRYATELAERRHISVGEALADTADSWKLLQTGTYKKDCRVWRHKNTRRLQLRREREAAQQNQNDENERPLQNRVMETLLSPNGPSPPARADGRGKERAESQQPDFCMRVVTPVRMASSAPSLAVGNNHAGIDTSSIECKILDNSLSNTSILGVRQSPGLGIPVPRKLSRMSYEDILDEARRGHGKTTVEAMIAELHRRSPQEMALADESLAQRFHELHSRTIMMGTQIRSISDLHYPAIGIQIDSAPPSPRVSEIDLSDNQQGTVADDSDTNLNSNHRCPDDSSSDEDWVKVKGG